MPGISARPRGADPCLPPPTSCQQVEKNTPCPFPVPQSPVLWLNGAAMPIKGICQCYHWHCPGKTPLQMLLGQGSGECQLGNGSCRRCIGSKLPNYSALSPGARRGWERPMPRLSARRGCREAAVWDIHPALTSWERTLCTAPLALHVAPLPHLDLAPLMASMCWHLPTLMLSASSPTRSRWIWVEIQTVAMRGAQGAEPVQGGDPPWVCP